MLLRRWDNIPEFMKNEEVYKYYDLLRKKKISIIIKRIFDICMSMFLIIILSPIILIISIFIKLDDKGPIFYRQERITQYGVVFKIYKFRTMVVNADKTGSLITVHDDKRITKVGKLIRKNRLDELPQLFNVVRGDMSFVGTRPEVKKYVDSYTNEMKATLLLPAGITSLASINFKDEDEMISSFIDESNSIDDVYIDKVLCEKMKYNIEYLLKFNLIMDIKVCMNTLK